MVEALGECAVRCLEAQAVRSDALLALAHSLLETLLVSAEHVGILLCLEALCELERVDAVEFALETLDLALLYGVVVVVIESLREQTHFLLQSALLTLERRDRGCHGDDRIGVGSVLALARLTQLRLVGCLVSRERELTLESLVGLKQVAADGVGLRQATELRREARHLLARLALSLSRLHELLLLHLLRVLQRAQKLVGLGARLVLQLEQLGLACVGTREARLRLGQLGRKCLETRLGRLCALLARSRLRLGRLALPAVGLELRIDERDGLLQCGDRRSALLELLTQQRLLLSNGGELAVEPRDSLSELADVRSLAGKLLRGGHVLGKRLVALLQHGHLAVEPRDSLSEFADVRSLASKLLRGGPVLGELATECRVALLQHSDLLVFLLQLLLELLLACDRLFGALELLAGIHELALEVAEVLVEVGGGFDTELALVRIIAQTESFSEAAVGVSQLLAQELGLAAGMPELDLLPLPLRLKLVDRGTELAIDGIAVQPEAMGGTSEPSAARQGAARRTQHTHHKAW